MKHLLCLAFSLAAVSAYATGNHQPPPPPAVPGGTATSSSSSSAAVSGIHAGGGVGGGVVDQSSTRMWALPGGAFSAGALPATWCVGSKQTYRKWLFGFYEGYDAGSQTDFECLKLLAELGAMQQAAPPVQPSMHFFLAPAVNSSAISTEKCEKPAAPKKRKVKNTKTAPASRSCN